MASVGTYSARGINVSGWIEALARAGYAAKGIVYLAVGVLSAQAAFQAGEGGGEGSRDAISQVVGGTAFGQAILAVVAVGLAGYVIWRVVQAVADPEERGTDARGIATRGAFLVSALVHAGLAVWAVRVLLGQATGGAGGSAEGASGAQSWSRTLLAQPWGQWLLGAVGLAILGYAAVEFRRAAARSYEKHMRRDLNGRTRHWAGVVARLGLSARGIVFLVIGGFVLYAAWTANPDQARGLEGTLDTLASQPFGSWLMGLVAVGLACYGLFQLVKARYRRIGPVF